MKFGNIINEILSNIPDNFLPKEDFENFLNNDQFSTEVINDPKKNIFLKN